MTPPQLVLALLLGLASCPTPAQPVPANALASARAAAVDGAVRAEMSRQQLVGVAVGVIEHGQIVYLKGYGDADRERGIPVTTETVFNWASNSKPLAAVAAMQLVERKLLDLDADVRNYVPEFPDKGAVITARQLLSHQSGIPHYSNGQIIPTARHYASARPFSDPINTLDRFNNSPLLFRPGERGSYSSYGYMLLSAVIQRAGKEPFETQVQERIAKPLGMRSLQVDTETDNQSHWAAGYVRGRRGEVVRAREEANYWKHGAGAFKSNIADFARWAGALINHELVSAAAEKQMWTAQKTAGGEAARWSLGFVVEYQDGLKVSHNGEQPEARSRLVIYPDARRGVVVMANCGYADPGALSTAVFSALGRR